MLFGLLFSMLCFASEAQEIWRLPFPAGDKPVAAFFDAASGAIYVSVQEGGRARLDRVSLQGKLEKKAVATAKGEPGPLRAFDGKLYWVAGGGVQIVDPKGARSSVPGVPDSAKASDIAVGRDGEVYLVLGQTDLYRISGGQAQALRKGKKITGIFLLLDRLYLLSEGKIVSFPAGKEPALERTESKLCDCAGLERTSAGAWLTVKGGEVRAGEKAILTLKAEIGRPAYVYRMDAAEDFFVLPLPGEGMLRAYRMPGIPKAKKTDK